MPNRERGTGLPMTETPPEPILIDGEVVEMPLQPTAVAGEHQMPPVGRPRPAQPRSSYPDQQRRDQDPAGMENPGSGYVRLRLRLRPDDGELSVVGAKAVDGPLAPGRLAGALAYEVTLHGRQLAVGSIPDAGVRRSFPGRDGERQGHHISDLSSYDVNVRVPKADINQDEMPRLEIAVYRVKEELPEADPERLPHRALADLFGRQLRQVGRLEGLRLEEMGERAATQVRQAFDLG